jgi:hypothetical protein
MNKYYKSTIHIIIIFVFIIVFLLGTNPNVLPLPLLVIPFLSVFILLYAVCGLFLTKFIPALSQRPRRVLSGVVAALPVMLVLLQSIGQLTLRDFVIVTTLITLLMFYFRKIDFLV